MRGGRGINEMYDTHERTHMYKYTCMHAYSYSVSISVFVSVCKQVRIHVTCMHAYSYCLSVWFLLITVLLVCFFFCWCLHAYMFVTWDMYACIFVLRSPSVTHVTVVSLLLVSLLFTTNVCMHIRTT